VRDEVDVETTILAVEEAGEAEGGVLEETAVF
jgi:hypothetical protein